MTDSAMAQADQLLHRGPDRRPVVDAHRGSGVGHLRAVQGDCGQSEFLQQHRPGITEAKIGDEHAVHPSGPGQFAVGPGLRIFVADQADRQQMSVGANTDSIPAMNAGKNGSDRNVSYGRAITKPRLPDRRVDNARAVAFGVNPSSAAARKIRARVSADTPARSFRAKETAAFDTLARAATSEIVGFIAIMRRLSLLQSKPVQGALVKRAQNKSEHRVIRGSNNVFEALRPGRLRCRVPAAVVAQSVSRSVPTDRGRPARPTPA